MPSLEETNCELCIGVAGKICAKKLPVGRGARVALAKKGI